MWFKKFGLTFMGAALATLYAVGAQAQASSVYCEILLGNRSSVNDTFVIPPGGGSGELYLDTHEYEGEVDIDARGGEVVVEISLSRHGVGPSASGEYGYAKFRVKEDGKTSDYVDVFVARLRCEVR